MLIKQVIIIRTDLNMRKGKMIAQGAHAAIAAMHHAIYDRREHGNDFVNQWFLSGATKICLQINSIEKLLEIYKSANDKKLPCALITDLGKTEFNGIKTITCCAIGPAPDTEIDLITKDLKLL